MSEKAKSADMRDMAKKKIQKWFNAIEYGDSSTHIKEKLSKRIAILIDFFSANGDIDLFCNLNNERLRKIKLENLTIEPSNFCKKFKSKNKDFFDLLFPDVEESTAQYYRECYRGTPLADTSTEAVIAMSAFYVNRLAKFAPKYARLKYILDYKDAIARIYENPDLEYEDLGYTEDDIRLYMSLYDELQTKILQQYFKRFPKGNVSYEEKEIEEIKKILYEIRPIYMKLMSDQSFDFERDILNIMLDARLVDKIYQLKEFSAKSLIYTAMTDRSKNIINWGYVAGDEDSNENLVLIGFDIKSLNMPIFVHMKKDDLISFLKDINGNAIMPYYYGGNDMYNYSLRQRMTTQIVYPPSKEEKNKKLLKVTGFMANDPFYKHIRWLQQPNNPPYEKYVPGSKMYNIESGEIFVSPVKQGKETGNSGRWKKWS